MLKIRFDCLQMKKGMRESQNLEFFWRQEGNMTDSTDDIFTHVLPLQLYMTYQSFGPDQQFIRYTVDCFYLSLMSEGLNVGFTRFTQDSQVLEL